MIVNKRNTIYLLGTYLLFEYYIHKRRTWQIKNQKKVLCKSPSSGSLDLLKEDILNAKGIEKQDLLVTLKESFSTNDINLENLVKELHNNHPYKKEHEVNDYLHIPLPFIVQVFLSFLNFYTLKKLSRISDIDIYKKDCYIYRFKTKKQNKKNKLLICFPGLSGSLIQLINIVTIILNSGYDVIIPKYGPGDLSLNHSLLQTEYDYCYDIINYLENKSYKNIHILAWSLGGVKYLCLEDIIVNYEYDIKIESVYLFEPLLSSRSVIDLYFTRKRSLFKTIEILNSRTLLLTYKYRFLNCIMSYFIHTILGYGCASSTNYLFHTEHKRSTIKRSYPRYLFVSHSDFIFNTIADYDIIKNNFVDKNVFYRHGYHGGWLKSRKLKNIFEKILLSQ
tara:strand:+ start:432 stop:1607 length:1176 start_codon:yes stop_codon:yes gene_type:complete